EVDPAHEVVDAVERDSGVELVSPDLASGLVGAPGYLAIRDHETTVAVRDPALADSPAQDAVARDFLPDDEVVRPVEGDQRRGLVESHVRRDVDPRGVEHGPGRRHARAVDVLFIPANPDN